MISVRQIKKDIFRDKGVLKDTHVASPKVKLFRSSLVGAQFFRTDTLPLPCHCLVLLVTQYRMLISGADTGGGGG